MDRFFTAHVMLTLLAFINFGCSEKNNGATTSVGTRVPIRERIPAPDLSAMQPQVANALEQARMRVDDRPESAAAWGQYGMLLDAHNLRTEAMEAYRHARRLAPNEFRWSYLLASTTEFFNAPAEDILVEYEAAAELLPTYPPTFVHMGEVLARLSEPASALEAYERAVALDPTLAYGWRGVGQMALLLDDPSRAVTALRNANTHTPDDRSITASLAQALRRQGSLEESVQMAERSRTLQEIVALPDPVRYEVSQMTLTASACRDRAIAFARQGNGDAALRALAPLEQVNPDDEFFHLTAGNAYAQIGAWKKARIHLERCLQVDPQMTTAYAELANVHMAQRQLGLAEDALLRALEIDPKNAAALATMGTIFIARGQESDAINAFEQAGAIRPLSVRHEAMLATALFRSGDAEAAIVRYESVLQRSANDVTARFNYGLALEQVGRVDDAVSQYKAVLVAQPAHAGARQRLGRLGR